MLEPSGPIFGFITKECVAGFSSTLEIKYELRRKNTQGIKTAQSHTPQQTQIRRNGRKKGAKIAPQKTLSLAQRELGKYFFFCFFTRCCSRSPLSFVAGRKCKKPQRLIFQRDVGDEEAKWGQIDRKTRLV